MTARRPLVVGPGVEARLDGDGSAWGLAAAVGVNVAMLATATVISVFKPRGRPRRYAPATPSVRRV